MKRIFYIIFLHQLCLSYAQEAHIEYRKVNNTGRSNTMQAVLDIKNGVTIYLPRFSTQVMADGTKSRWEGNPDWEYLKIDHKTHNLVYFDEYGRNKFLVSDAYYERKWKITEESKEIAGHTCYKATLDFRGVIWTAWFAPDIPLPYGPWKLYGLPGLIIEVADDTNTCLWRVDKIEYKHGELFDKEFASLVETRNKEPEQLKQFIQEHDEYYANVEAEILASTPGITMVKKPPHRVGLELKYEWEE